MTSFSTQAAVKLVMAMIVVVMNAPACDPDVVEELEGIFDECRPFMPGKECDLEGALVCAISDNGYYSCFDALELGQECGANVPAESRCGEGLECHWLERFKESRCLWAEEMRSCDNAWECAPGLLCDEYGPEGKKCLLTECSTSAQCPPCQACTMGVCALDFDCEGQPDCHE